MSKKTSKSCENLIFKSLGTGNVFLSLAINANCDTDKAAALAEAWKGLKAAKSGGEELLGDFAPENETKNAMLALEKKCAELGAELLRRDEKIQSMMPPDLVAEASAIKEAEDFMSQSPLEKRVKKKHL